MRIGSLFSGAGGLDLAVQAVFGGEVIWHAEIDKAASKVLSHHWPGVLNLGDVSDINWDSVPPVDILCGGFPCQDVSAAGKRAGIKDGTRSGLWAVFAEAIDWLHPRIVVIENVRGLLSALAHRKGETDGPSDVESGAAVMGDGAGRPVLRAAGAVLGDLADLGYDAQWATVAASDVGAPHRRERVFIVAYAAEQFDPQGARSDGSQQAMVGAGTRTNHRDDAGNPASGVQQLGRDSRCESPDARDTSRNGRHEGRPEPAGLQRGSDAAVSRDGHGVDTPLLPTPRARFGDSGESGLRRHSPGIEAVRHHFPQLLPTPNASDCSGGGMHPDSRYNADGLRHSQQLIDAVKLETERFWGKYEPAIRRWEQLTRPAPAPTEPNKNGNPRLSAAFSEWLMGWPAGWVTNPAIGISRNDQLRIVGNGVCPQQATAAITFLLEVA